MFEIGGYVIYRSEGVCKISDIRKESFGALGGQGLYYILSPLNDEKSTVFVPVDNEALLAMMRPLMSAAEICRLAEELREERLEWIQDSRARSSYFRELLARGDRNDLIRLVHTVTAHKEEVLAKGKKVATTEEALLKRAIHMLYEEFAVTTDLGQEDDVLPLLRGEIEVGSK